MFKAVGFRVLVRPDSIEEKTRMANSDIEIEKKDGNWVTKTGLLIDPAVNELAEKGARISGVIVDIGEIAWKAFNPQSLYAGLQVGDRVFFAKYAGKLLVDPVTNEEFVVLNDEDIVAKYIADE